MPLGKGSLKRRRRTSPGRGSVTFSSPGVNSLRSAALSNDVAAWPRPCHRALITFTGRKIEMAAPFKALCRQTTRLDCAVSSCDNVESLERRRKVVPSVRQDGAPRAGSRTFPIGGGVECFTPVFLANARCLVRKPFVRSLRRPAPIHHVDCSARRLFNAPFSSSIIWPRDGGGSPAGQVFTSALKMPAFRASARFE